MELSRNFVLRKGTFLTCVSYQNMISDPLLNLYFTSPAEAIFALFREPVVAPFELSIGQELSPTPQRTNEIDDLYLNTFYLSEDLVINPLPNSNLELELKTDPNLAEVRAAIRNDCQTSQRDGFVIPYVSSFVYQQGQKRFRVTGRITTYVVCQQNLLLHAQSFRILKQVLVADLLELTSTVVNLSGGVIIDILTRYLKDNRDRVLEEVYIQPDVNGLATSPVIVPPTLPIIQPPSSMLSPKDPSTFIPQQMSPGGITAYDAFISVPTDVIRVMALNMTLDALAKTCATSRRFNDAICNSNDFWYLRVQQDFARRDATVVRRKPENWQWRRYYAELSGNLSPAHVLDFAKLDDNPQLLAELNELPRDEYEARVNQLRRDAGLGLIDFERPEFQATRRPLPQRLPVARNLQALFGDAPEVMRPVMENPNVGLFDPVNPGALERMMAQPARGNLRNPFVFDFPDRVDRPRQGPMVNADFDGDPFDIPDWIPPRVVPENPMLVELAEFYLDLAGHLNRNDLNDAQLQQVLGSIDARRGNRSRHDQFIEDVRAIDNHRGQVNLDQRARQRLARFFLDLEQAQGRIFRQADPAPPVRAEAPLFADQADADNFFGVHNPQAIGRVFRRAPAQLQGPPAHLMQAFDEYRDLLLLINSGAEYLELRNEIFARLVRRARAVNARPTDVLDRQLEQLRQLRGMDQLPAESDDILRRELAMYLNDQLVHLRG